MSDAVAINWPEVRILALVVGVREAARRMGISEETVKKRCTREGWLDSPEAKAANRNAIANRSGITVSPHLSPAALIHAELADLGSKTKLSIARGVAKAAETVEKMQGSDILTEAQNVKSVAQTASMVHSWDRTGAAPKIRLELLASKGEVTAIDIESEVVSDDWAEDY